MMLKDIYIIQIQLRKCNDRRPCIIIDPPTGNRVKIAVISAAMDMYDRFTDFLIDSNHENFGATGLSRTCYIRGHFLEVNISQLSKNPIGRLTGDLERDFDKWL